MIKHFNIIRRQLPSERHSMVKNQSNMLPPYLILPGHSWSLILLLLLKISFFRYLNSINIYILRNFMKKLGIATKISDGLNSIKNHIQRHLTHLLKPCLLELISMDLYMKKYYIQYKHKLIAI